MAIYTLLQKGSFRLPLTLIACAVIVVCGIVYSNNRNQIDQSLRVATTHEPDNFSELYFTDYTNLPKVLVAGKYYQIPFTIANRESKQFTYTYQIQYIDQNISYASPVKTVTVANDAAIHETARIIARKPGDQVELFIRLLNKNLTIHYKAQS